MAYAKTFDIKRKAYQRRLTLARKGQIVAKQVLRTYSERVK